MYDLFGPLINDSRIASFCLQLRLGFGLVDLGLWWSVGLGTKTLSISFLLMRDVCYTEAVQQFVGNITVSPIAPNAIPSSV